MIYSDIQGIRTRSLLFDTTQIGASAVVSMTKRIAPSATESTYDRCHPTGLANELNLGVSTGWWNK